MAFIRLAGFEIQASDILAIGDPAKLNRPIALREQMQRQAARAGDRAQAGIRCAALGRPSFLAAQCNRPDWMGAQLPWFSAPTDWPGCKSHTHPVEKLSQPGSAGG